jgi:hypothetical protein
VKFLQRYWVAGLLIAMVLIHAAIIGYVRSRIAHLNEVETTTIRIGSFRFQPVSEPRRVFQFDLHAVLDPSRRHQAKERISNRRFEILEAAEQLLRQIPVDVLQDPAQTVLRERLMEVILEQVTEPVVQRVVITGWLEVPVGTFPARDLPARDPRSRATAQRPPPTLPNVSAPATF